MKDFEHLCRESGDLALDALISLVTAKSTPPNTRLAAINSLLDRGFGKAIDRQALLSIDVSAGQDAQLTDEQLLRIAAAGLDESK